MSNRNKKSKSPQLQQPKNIDKDLTKYLIYQKIVKPQAPLELITKTQPDEDSEVEDFKLEIEMKYKSCKINHTFKFPKENYESSSDTSLQSLKDVTIYNLNCDNLDRLTDATQPNFMKVLNERLMKLTDLIVDESQVKNKQYNYAPNLKSSRMQQLRGTNISNTSITKTTELSLNAASQSQGRESVITKPPSNLGFRATPTLSSEKKNRSKQIQQILKITQQKYMNNQNIGGTFYKKTPQVNNNYININSNINNSIVVTGKRNVQDIRIKTEQDDPEPSLHQYQVVPNSRPKMRESTLKSKKLDISIGYKNITLDSQYLENYSRNAKSQNKNYKSQQQNFKCRNINKFKISLIVFVAAILSQFQHPKAQKLPLFNELLFQENQLFTIYSFTFLILDWKCIDNFDGFPYLLFGQIANQNSKRKRFGPRHASFKPFSFQIFLNRVLAHQSFLAFGLLPKEQINQIIDNSQLIKRPALFTAICFEFIVFMSVNYISLFMGILIAQGEPNINNYLYVTEDFIANMINDIYLTLSYSIYLMNLLFIVMFYTDLKNVNYAMIKQCINLIIFIDQEIILGRIEKSV